MYNISYGVPCELQGILEFKKIGKQS